MKWVQMVNPATLNQCQPLSMCSHSPAPFMSQHSSHPAVPLGHAWLLCQADTLLFALPAGRPTPGTIHPCVCSKCFTGLYDPSPPPPFLGWAPPTVQSHQPSPDLPSCHPSLSQIPTRDLNARDATPTLTGKQLLPFTPAKDEPHASTGDRAGLQSCSFLERHSSNSSPSFWGLSFLIC